MLKSTYIKHTPRGKLLAIFSEIENKKYELVISNVQRTHQTAKRLANKSTKVNLEQTFRDMGWRPDGK